MPRATLTPAQREIYEIAVARFLAANPQVSPSAVAVTLSLTTLSELAALVEPQVAALRADLVAQEAEIDATAAAAHTRLQQQIAAIDSFPF